MDRRRKTLLLAALLPAVAGALVALAWWEGGFPLRYLRPERMSSARVVGADGRARRELTAAEAAELCRLLRSARSVGEVDGEARLRVELPTADYGDVRVEDFGGPGARLVLHAGNREESRHTVHSEALGQFLTRLNK